MLELISITDHVLLPILIVLARMTDVSLGTLRIILVSKNYRKIAPFISFLESLIWITVAARIITTLGHWTAFFAYALGYALGTYMGMKIDAKLSLGRAFVRVIVARDFDKLEQNLRENKFGVTSVAAEGKDGYVKILFIVLNRTELANCIDTITKTNPSAFYTVESIQTTNAGYFSEGRDGGVFNRFSRMLSTRK